MQMICALLIFQRPELPAPLWHLSPWLDHTIAPPDDVYARLAGQPHRRFIKTHTPLDGIPLRPAGHLHRDRPAPARHVRVAVPPSRQHRTGPRMPQASGNAPPIEPREAGARQPAAVDRATTVIPAPYPESLPQRHAAPVRRVGPARRAERAAGALRRPVRGPRGPDARHRLAARDQPCRSSRWPALVRAATFERMRDRADRLVPAAPGIVQRTRRRSSAAAPRGPGARFSATRRSPATTRGPPGWPRRTCSPGCTHRPVWSADGHGRAVTDRRARAARPDRWPSPAGPGRATRRRMRWWMLSRPARASGPAGRAPHGRTGSGTGRRTARRPPSSSSCGRAPRTRPSSMTRIWSASRMVDSRWAMTSEVRPARRGPSARWTAASDSESRCAVASSSTTTAGAFSSSRAMAIRCFSPPDSR